MSDPDPTKAYKPVSAAGQDVAADTPHPSDEQLYLFVGGRLDQAESQSAQNHVSGCTQCVTRLKQLVGSIASLVASIEQITTKPNATALTPQSDPNEIVDHDTTTPSTPKATHTAAEHFGDYELITEIARGGMGVVYKARQKSLNRIVALKMIKSGEFANQEQVDRFYKEAEAAANLDHPGIVPVYEVGEVDGLHYFTMGFVDGESLAVRLRNGPMPRQDAAQYAKSIAEAVANAHSKGVIHRDLKPGNVLINTGGQLRITDFGLAKRIEEDSELTSTGQVLGTPSYMPPEQAEGRLDEIGPAADVYAIGATLYCMLAGRPPFQAANAIETLNEVLNSEPVSLRSLNSMIPADLETLCLKCLEKKPSNRYPSAQELVNELNRFLRGEPIHVRPIGRCERAWRWCKRKPLAAGFILLVVTLAVGGPLAAIAQSLANRRTAIARVDTLLKASPATIPLVLEELDRDATIVESRLRELDSKELLPPQRIRVSLALLPYDSSQHEKLKQRFNDCTYEELAVIVDRWSHHDVPELAHELWALFRSQHTPESNKFRAGIVLAALDPDSSQWESSDYDFLVTSMLAENSVYQPAIRRSLRPIAAKLIVAVTSAYNSAESGTPTDESSANAIVDFAANDSGLLTDLACTASPKQHSVLFPGIAKMSDLDESVIHELIEITKQQPRADYTETKRVKLGKKRAGAAISLLRLGHPDASLEVLRIDDDPESLTQFAHGCKDRGVTIEQLLDLLKRTTSASERYGIIMALGEFAVRDIPMDIRSTWVNYVKHLYGNDPSSCVHGASGWLLRQWGFRDEAKVIEERAVPYEQDREWFTLAIDLTGLGQESYFTFVVLPAGVYQIGSPDYEQDRRSDESVHIVRVTSDFAVLDREITRGDYEAYRQDIPADQFSKTLDSAMVGPNWYQSVRFCRWLTMRFGKSEFAQCYADPANLDQSEYPPDPDPVAEGMPLDWPIDLFKTGFRLPTESEWEVACRGGMVSRYGFGCDERYLARYGWYTSNSGRRPHVGRELRPTIRGLFDLHGNVYEWCHDFYGSYPRALQEDPIGSGIRRVIRGGGWDYDEAGCRAANRFSHPMTSRSPAVGFRLVFRPHMPEPE